MRFLDVILSLNIAKQTNKYQTRTPIPQIIYNAISLIHLKFLKEMFRFDPAECWEGGVEISKG